MLQPVLLMMVMMTAMLPIMVDSGEAERRLLNTLLEQYNKLERPVYNESDPVVLKFGLTLQQIIDVDEKNQILTTNIWLNLEWNDVNLKWNKSEFGNIQDIRIPPKHIWKPDLLMYNSADEAFDGTYHTNVVVTHEGQCTYIPPGIFKSTCKIDITWFPFDDQTCDMKFGSWTYDGFKLDLQKNNEGGGDLQTYVDNGEWHLMEVPAERNEQYYDCCPDVPYLDITFQIKIRRRTLYYFFNLIIPCVLIASMAVLGFTLPSDSGEKLSLGVAIMLTVTIFATIVADMLPVSNNTPLIGTYFNCIMFMVASSVVTTIMILNYHHRQADTHQMPPWVKMLFLQWLPWLLRMSRPGEKLTMKTIMMQSKMKELDMKETSSKSLLANVLDMDDDYRIIRNGMGISTVNRTFCRSSMTLHEFGESFAHSGIHRELVNILKEIRVISDKIRSEDEAANIENDWKFAAMVLDRICLITFSMFTVVATVVVLAAAPHVIVR